MEMKDQGIQMDGTTGAAQMNFAQMAPPQGGQTMYQQPVYGQPVFQQGAQPMYQQPVYGQPVYQQPTFQQPTSQQPMYQQPTYQEATQPQFAADPSAAAEPKFDQNRLGEMFTMVDDVMNGEADASKIMSFLQNSEGDFLKGAIVGAAAMFLLNTPVVKESLAGVLGAAFGQGDPGPDAFGNTGEKVDFPTANPTTAQVSDPLSKPADTVKTDGASTQKI
ncbi:MAG: hypothetical protein ACNI27_10490 [Desulfovibrio sp.]